MTYSEQNIQRALCNPDVTPMMELIREGADIDSFCISHKTDILLEAILKQKYGLLNLVKEKSFNCSRNGFCYLHHSIKTNDLEIIKQVWEMYTDQGISHDELDDEANNLLHTACSRSSYMLNDYIINMEIVRFLMQGGINWSHRNIHGHTPLHVLLRNTNALDDDIVHGLLTNKEVWRQKDAFGISAMDIVNSYAHDYNWQHSSLGTKLMTAFSLI